MRKHVDTHEAAFRRGFCHAFIAARDIFMEEGMEQQHEMAWWMSDIAYDMRCTDEPMPDYIAAFKRAWREVRGDSRV